MTDRNRSWPACKQGAAARHHPSTRNARQPWNPPLSFRYDSVAVFWMAVIMGMRCDNVDGCLYLAHGLREQTQLSNCKHNCPTLRVTRASVRALVHFAHLSSQLVEASSRFLRHMSCVRRASAQFKRNAKCKPHCRDLCHTSIRGDPRRMHRRRAQRAASPYPKS